MSKKIIFVFFRTTTFYITKKGKFKNLKSSTFISEGRNLNKIKTIILFKSNSNNKKLNVNFKNIDQ
jgi:hypothetical protein